MKLDDPSRICKKKAATSATLPHKNKNYEKLVSRNLQPVLIEAEGRVV